MRKSLTLAALLLAFGAAALPAATRTINYQGQLTDLSDNTINGTPNMAFELYDAVTGGSLVASWAASAVPVTRGLFNVELNLPALTSAQLAGDLYLQVTVAGNTLSPRKRILYSLLAVSADSVQGLVPGSSAGNIPVILTSTGKLDPAILSAPFPLVVSGTGSSAAAAGVFDNLDNGAGQVGLRAIGQDAGIEADVRDSAGVAIRGDSTGAAASTGILGTATDGVGVRARANNQATTAVQAINIPGVALYGNGETGAFLSASNLGLRIGGSPLGGQNAAAPITGVEIYSQGSGIVINNTGSGAGLDATNNGNGIAISGKANGANAIALRGAHVGPGFGSGVWGQTDSKGGTGVHGEAGNGTGSGVGVDGASGSPDGWGVRGSSPGIGVQGSSTDSGSSGTSPYGVAGFASGVNGHALHGVASGSGSAYAVYGLADSSNGGAGVYGRGLNSGVLGVATGNAGSTGVKGSAPVTGVEGEGSAVSGSSWGVKGSVMSPSGMGVEGKVLGVGSGAGAGVYGQSLAAQGLGVLGEGPAAGVRGQTTGALGHGVDGWGGAGGNGLGRSGVYGSLALNPGEVGYGIYGTVAGSSGDGYAIYAFANSSSHRGLRAYNVVAINNQPGYALGVEGKLKIGSSNAGFINAIGSTASSWLVTSPYIGTGDTVVITPAADITQGATVANAVWVSPNDVLDGNFTVRSAQPIANFQFYYLVIDKD